MGVPANSTPLWALLASQAAPLVALGTLFGKLNEIADVEGLARSERRRLRAIVDAKLASVRALIVFHVVGGLVLALALYAASFNASNVKWAFALAGGLIGLAVHFTATAYRDTQHIAGFKTKVADRARESKARSALVKKMLDDPGSAPK